LTAQGRRRSAVGSAGSQPLRFNQAGPTYRPGPRESNIDSTRPFVSSLFSTWCARQPGLDIPRSAHTGTARETYADQQCQRGWPPTTWPSRGLGAAPRVGSRFGDWAETSVSAPLSRLTTRRLGSNIHLLVSGPGRPAGPDSPGSAPCRLSASRKRAGSSSS
jgi:hypothetical protein